MNSDLKDLIIIGGGPAGLTAAIYSSRAFVNTLVIEGNPRGGQLMLTTDVENYPGFTSGVMGPALIEDMRNQALRFGAELVDQNVVKVDGDARSNFTVNTDSGQTYSAKSLIIASGASAKWLGLESETRLRGKGVSACATCDGFFFKNKIVAVVGGGDSAMEEATFLTKFASKVFVLVRAKKEDVRASKYMLDKALKNPKIEFVYQAEVIEVLGEEKVSGVKVKNLVSGVESVMENIDGLFLAIGHKPNTDFLKGFVELDKVGFVSVTNNTLTSKEGVFTAGDVSDFRYRQAITAAGLGCMASLDVEKYLETKSHE